MTKDELFDIQNQCDRLLKLNIVPRSVVRKGDKLVVSDKSPDHAFWKDEARHWVQTCIGPLPVIE